MLENRKQLDLLIFYQIRSFPFSSFVWVEHQSEWKTLLTS